MTKKTTESFSIGEPVWKCFRVGMNGPSFEIADVVGFDGEFLLLSDLTKKPIKFPPSEVFKLTDLKGMQCVFSDAMREIRKHREEVRQAVQLVHNMDTDTELRQTIKNKYPHVYDRWVKYQSKSG
jgi:hypothetical protein